MKAESPRAKVEVAAAVTGLSEYAIERIFDHIVDHDIPHVLVAHLDRGPASTGDYARYLSFDASKTPEQIAEAIGAGQKTAQGIREVLRKGCVAWVIVGPEGFMVGGRRSENTSLRNQE